MVSQATLFLRPHHSMRSLRQTRSASRPEPAHCSPLLQQSLLPLPTTLHGATAQTIQPKLRSSLSLRTSSPQKPRPSRRLPQHLHLPLALPSDLVDNQLHSSCLSMICLLYLRAPKLPVHRRPSYQCLQCGSQRAMHTAHRSKLQLGCSHRALSYGGRAGTCQAGTACRQTSCTLTTAA